MNSSSSETVEEIEMTSDKATRELTIERLKVLRDMERIAPVGYGFRFYLDRIMGGYHFYEKALPTNWQSTPKKLRKIIPQSHGVVLLKQSGITDREIGKLVVLEHAYTMRELMAFVINERYNDAIDAYDVRFITRTEDAALKVAEKMGGKHQARYDMAGIEFATQQSVCLPTG